MAELTTLICFVVTTHVRCQPYMTRLPLLLQDIDTDGAVSDFGRGSLAVVMLPLELSTPEIEVKRVHTTLISSLEAEIAALVLAMERAIMYFEDSAVKSKVKQGQRPVDYSQRLQISHQVHPMNIGHASPS